MHSLNLSEIFWVKEIVSAGNINKIELEDDSSFMGQLIEVIKNLPEGDYSFEFYFYIESFS